MTPPRLVWLIHNNRHKIRSADADADTRYRLIMHPLLARVVNAPSTQANRVPCTCWATTSWVCSRSSAASPHHVGCQETFEKWRIESYTFNALVPVPTKLFGLTLATFTISTSDFNDINYPSLSVTLTTRLGSLRWLPYLYFWQWCHWRWSLEYQPPRF